MIKPSTHRISLLLALVASLILLAPHSSAETKAQATVLAVIDGDTLRVRLDETRELLRLIGIDTPEARFNKRAEQQAARSETDAQTILKLGERAKSAVSGMVPLNSPITIEFDVERRDHYGRLLGYVYLPDGSMLNEKILLLGYGKLLTVPPNVRYAARLRLASEAGRTARRGLWSMDGFDETRSHAHPPLPPIFKGSSRRR